jgi:hypothetical protein
MQYFFKNKYRLYNYLFLNEMNELTLVSVSVCARAIGSTLDTIGCVLGGVSKF